MASDLLLSALRSRIAEMEGQGQRVRQRIPTGVPEMDEALGGIPRPGMVEVCGAEGTGRTRLVLHIVCKTLGQGEDLAWVDGDHSFFSPAVRQWGVDFSRILMVRPPKDGGPLALWAVEQLLRSGSFFPVVMYHVPMLGRTWGRRLALAAEQGQTTGIVIQNSSSSTLTSDLRVSVSGNEVCVLRNHGGTPKGVFTLPPPPVGFTPWD